MQYDVILSSKKNATGPVLLTLVDKGEADGLATHLNSLAIFQGEDLVATVHEVERDPKAPGYYDLNASTVIDQVKDLDSEDDLLNVLALELDHPKFEGGRKTVLEAIEERVRHLQGDDPNDPGDLDVDLEDGEPQDEA